MGKISEILKEKKKSNECIFTHIMNDLLVKDAGDYDAVNKAIDGAESGWSISTALRAGGYKVAPSTVALHIKKGCKCYGSN